MKSLWPFIGSPTPPVALQLKECAQLGFFMSATALEDLLEREYLVGFQHTIHASRVHRRRLPQALTREGSNGYPCPSRAQLTTSVVSIVTGQVTASN